MQVSHKIDRRPRTAEGGPRVAGNLVQNNVYTGKVTDTVVFLVKSGSICIKNSVKCFLKFIQWETVR